jgi:hypothetical protein
MGEILELLSQETLRVPLTRAPGASKVSGLGRLKQQTGLGTLYLVAQALHNQAAFPS